MKRTIVTLGFMFVIACGGAVDAPAPEGTGHPPDEYRDGIGHTDTPDAAPDSDGSCWQCAAVGWVDSCHQVVAPDAESCLHCGLRCDGG